MTLAARAALRAVRIISDMSLYHKAQMTYLSYLDQVIVTLMAVTYRHR